MKKQITLSTILTLASVSLFAQVPAKQTPAKVLPKKVTITLTSEQVIQFDAAIKEGAKAIDSKTVEQQYNAVFKPFYDQVTAQMVADTTKTKKP